MEPFFFDSWNSLLRTAVVGVLAYAGLVFLLRISGKRTLSKMNAFDFVVTVALGSTLATILLNKDVALAQGLLAFAMLIGMQLVVTWSSAHTNWVKKVVTGEPALLLYRGAFLPDALLTARVTRNEIRAAIRAKGHADIEKLEAVVLETDGSFSVVAQPADSGKSSLDGMKTPSGESVDNKGIEQGREGEES